MWLPADVLGIKQQERVAGCSIGGYTLYELWREVRPGFWRSPSAVQGRRPMATSGDAVQGIDSQDSRARDGRFYWESTLEKLIGPTAHRRHPERVAEVRQNNDTDVSPAAVIAVQQGLAVFTPLGGDGARHSRTGVWCWLAAKYPVSTPGDLLLLAETIRNGGYGGRLYGAARRRAFRSVGYSRRWWGDCYGGFFELCGRVRLSPCVLAFRHCCSRPRIVQILFDHRFRVRFSRGRARWRGVRRGGA